jgi:3'(2'), 5'-bisphosphate nucleotidase
VTRARSRGLATLVTPVTALAREAGRAILAVYREEFEVRSKADGSPLTRADLDAHTVIRQGLAAIDPGLPMLSEESADLSFAARKDWQRYWLVDPLDGTREFVSRSGEFTVNIALVHGSRPVFGVVHAPLLDLTYYGGDDLGAYRFRDDEPPERIATRAPQGRELVVFASRSHAGPRTTRFLRQLEGAYELTVVHRGSALKACYVADGQAHLYPRFGATSEWDTAAAQAVVEAAGGVVREIGRDAPLRYNKPDLRNPAFYVAYGPEAPHP